MFRLTIALFLVVLNFQAHAEDAESLFQKGLGDYQAKKFEAAQTDFLQALKLEPDNVRVLHNLALSHFQLNQKAPAIAYWRKALAIDPGYRPARLGRELMEAKMNVRPFERDPMDLWQERALERLSPVALGWVLAFCFAATGALWLRFLVARRTARDLDGDAPNFPFGAAMASLVLAAGLVALALKMNQVFLSRATVVGEKVSARSLPADEGVSLFEVPGGVEVLIRHAQGDWRQVETPEGTTGWLKRADIVPASEG